MSGNLFSQIHISCFSPTSFDKIAARLFSALFLDFVLCFLMFSTFTSPERTSIDFQIAHTIIIGLRIK